MSIEKTLNSDGIWFLCLCYDKKGRHYLLGLNISGV